MDRLLHQAINFFTPNQGHQTCTPFGEGKVNDTWLVEFERGMPRILQRLRKTVFPQPEVIITNLRRVTDHLQSSLANQSNKHFFSLCKNPDGHDHLIDQEGNCWRMLSYIKNSRTISRVTNREQATELGKMLANFHDLVARMDATTLVDPLPGFHQPSFYLQQFDQVAKMYVPQQETERSCCAIIERLREYSLLLENKTDELGAQVIHADPKVTNFLFSADTDRVISLIDLDTVKQGLLVHDLGDCLRSCCNPLGEEGEDPSQIQFHCGFFTAFLAGYAKTGKHHLNTTDKKYLVDAVKIISFELGLRFFTDHISGNTYFNCDFPGQNLERALIQFALAKSIDSQREKMEQVITTIF